MQPTAFDPHGIPPLKDAASFVMLPSHPFPFPVHGTADATDFKGTAMDKPNYRAAIFDLDGTLLNTLDDLANAANAALHSAGYPQHPVAAYRQFVGNGLRMLVRRALPEGEADRLGPAGFETLVGRTGDNYAQNWAAATRPYPHIPELLQELQRRGIPLAVVTNKPHEWTLHMLKHYFPDEPFLFIQGAMPNLPHKPDPAGALNAARHLGVAPHEAAFVGDSNVDMLTARNAGMAAVGVDWGFRGAQELKESGADTILYDPLELLPLFEGYAS